MKAHNLTYEGEFKNHQFSGKGKLTVQVNASKTFETFNTTFRPSKSKNFINTNSDTVTLTMIGSFSANRLDGYGNVNASKDENRISNKYKDIFVLWNNNKLIGIL